MAKKKTQQTRKTPRSTTPRMYSDDTPVPTTASAGVTTPEIHSAGAAKPITTGGRGTMPIEQEYAYVMGDLKRLGIVALGGFTFIVIMGFIFR